jgi:hypothetical protein
VTAGAVFGSLAGLLGVANIVPYVRDVLRRTTRPHRGTWLIWSTLALLALGSQLADGARWSAVLVGTEAVCTSLVLVLSIRRGEGGLARGDLAALAIAGAGVVGWAVSSTPVIATAFVVAASGLGVALMLPKTWRDPFSETLSTYVLGAGAGVAGALAVGGLHVSLLLFPAYYAVGCTLVAFVIMRARARLAVAAVVAPDPCVLLGPLV